MPDISIDIDVDDFLNECSKREIKEVIKWLEDSDYLVGHELPGNFTHSEELFYNNVKKLSGLYLAMTKEDHDVIEAILKKY